MRVLHLPASYLPWTVGGKEVYTHNLARELSSLGMEQRIAIHQSGPKEPIGVTSVESIAVTVLPPLVDTQLRRNVYGCRTERVPGFEQLLNQYRPHLVHFHDFSVGANLTHLQMAKDFGAGLVMTIHSPGQICPQRELLYHGKHVCDGKVLPVRCTECRLAVSGVPVPLAGFFARTRLPFLPVERSNSLLRAATGRLMTDLFRDAWAEMVENVDRIQVHAVWTAEVLRRNSVPEEKIAMIRTGLPRGTRCSTAEAGKEPSSFLKVAVVGRCERIKGPQVVAKALLQLSREFPVRVSFIGPYWDSLLGQQIRKLLVSHGQIYDAQLIPNEELLATLRGFDISVVPSLWQETGPLTVLESFAAGLPVVGSRLGGIQELVTDGVDGLLFPAGDDFALAGIFRRLCQDQELLRRLRRGVSSPRTMAHVAQEISDLYRSVLDKVN